MNIPGGEKENVSDWLSSREIANCGDKSINHENLDG